MQTSSSSGGTAEAMNFKELESKLLNDLKNLAAIVDSASHVNQILSLLEALAHLLFHEPTVLEQEDVDKDCSYKLKIVEKDVLRHAFYRGVCFPSLANILLFKVASNWLACFSMLGKKLFYDRFFLDAPASEAIQVLVPALQYSRTYSGCKETDKQAIVLNAERLLILILVENKGVKRLAVDFGISIKSKLHGISSHWLSNMECLSKVAQLLSAIPDKARLEAPEELRSYYFFQQVAKQLLSAAEEHFKFYFENVEDAIGNDGILTFIGESFSRICRRGYADIIAFEIVRELLQQIRECQSSETCMIDNEALPSYIKSYWYVVSLSIKDLHAFERWSEALLLHMAATNITELEAYHMMHVLFDERFKQDSNTRVLFTEKFLLWKVFPLSCLKWILQFSVFCCSPMKNLQEQTGRIDINVIRHLVDVWCKREFLQTASMEQQAYITAAIGLSVQSMTKQQLESSSELLHLLIQGVSCRLESPNNPIRKMASCIALIFSKVINPNKPLFLDDESCHEKIDWGFGVIEKQSYLPKINGVQIVSHNDSEIESVTATSSNQPLEKESIPACTVNKFKNGTSTSEIKSENFKELVSTTVDPDEVIDPASLHRETWSYEDDNESVMSENESESSLVPYDMIDDDSDLRGKQPSQLSDCLTALRKSDDPDGVEGALEVSEKLVRALPDELDIFATELVSALVHVRCNDVTVEGEEESAEGKRHCTLVALLVTCPLKSVEVLTKLLYSSHVDISQRLLILDVMADAAKELSQSRNTSITNSSRKQSGHLITEVGNHPWFLPSSENAPAGAGPWKEVSYSGTMINWSNVYEREIPSRSTDKKLGKIKRRGHHSLQLREREMNQHKEQTINKFPLYAAAFMLPVMRGYDKRQHGVDMLGRDFIVLGKMIYMLGVCMECIAFHPEALTLASYLLDMLRSRDISHHPEAYVRRSALYAVSRALIALHPSYVATAFSESNNDIIRLLDWVRNWALLVTDSDVDHDCSMMAMACVQLHSDIALQAARLMNPVGEAIADKGKTSNIIPRKTILMPDFKNSW